MLLNWKRAIVFLIVACVAGASMVSAVNFSSLRILNCGTVVYGRRAFDLNRDGRINIIDAAMIARAFGSCLECDRWDHSLDVNGDGSINEVDLSIIVSSYGTE